MARTWEHWWHGNECFRAQGRPATAPASRSARRRPAARRSACRSSISSTFLGQASTESQGPWDSNYQIEDDFSWFLPGKKGDHDLKFGVRYNYTELERVSQINENGTFRFNTDPPFDAANPRTYPERLTIRTGTFNEFIKNHTYEGFAQDKWRIGQQHDAQHRPPLRPRDHPARRDRQPAVPGQRQELPGGQEQLLAARRLLALAR